jgi:hypothetical protein
MSVGFLLESVDDAVRTWKDFFTFIFNENLILILGNLARTQKEWTY